MVSVSLLIYDKNRRAGFQRAIDLDPKFAMAYALLGTSWSNLGERSRGMEFMGKAYKLREGASEQEKFYIDSYYHDIVTGNLDKARQTYEVVNPIAL